MINAEDGQVIHRELIIFREYQKNKEKHHEIVYQINGENAGSVQIPKKNEIDVDHYLRLSCIVRRIESVIDHYRNVVVGIGGYSFGSFRKGLLAQLAELGGFVRVLLKERNIKFYDIPPTTLKGFISNSGAAKKEGIQSDILKKYFILFEDDNEADAFVLSRIVFELGDETSVLIAKKGLDRYRRKTLHKK